MGGTRSHNCTPPLATRSVIFRDDAGSSHGGPRGRERPSMSPTAKLQQRLKSPRMEGTQIPTILPPTERALLAALNVHTAPAENAPSRSSAAPSGARPSSATPRPHNPLETPCRDAEAVPTKMHSPRPPPQGGGSATTQQPRQEGPHTPQGTSAHASRGVQGYGTVPGIPGAFAAPPTMTTQATPRRPNTKQAQFPTLAAMQARSIETLQHQQSRTNGTEQGTDGAVTENLEMGETEAALSSATSPSPTPPRPLPGPDNNAGGGAPSSGSLAAKEREAMPAPFPVPPQPRGPLGLEELRSAYGVYHSTPPHDLVDTFRRTSKASNPTGRLP